MSATTWRFQGIGAHRWSYRMWNGPLLAGAHEISVAFAGASNKNRQTESVGAIVPKGVKQYPWDEWLAMPFRPHDAPSVPNYTMFKQTLRNKAYQNRLRVAIVAGDPVRFQFYYPDQPKPVLAPHTVELQTVTCAVCGLVQTRAPHLVDVPECLMRNPKDPGDPEMYYAHRNDSTEASGFARVVLVETIAPSAEAGE